MTAPPTETTEGLSPVEKLCAAAKLISSVDALAVRDLDDSVLTEFTARLEAVSRSLAPLQVAAASQIVDASVPDRDNPGLAARHGFVKPAHLLESLTRVSGAEAARRIQLAGALTGERMLTGTLIPARYATVAASLQDADFGLEAATTIVRALEGARRGALWDDLPIAEASLVGFARTEPIDVLTKIAAVVRDRLDPDGVLPREEETRARRGIRLGREHHGITPISGGLVPETAALLAALFQESNAPGAKPRFISDRDRADGTTTVTEDDGTTTVTFLDPRTRDQRQADTLAGVITAGIRNLGTVRGQMRSTASVTATITLAELQSGRGIGWIDGIDAPVPAATIQRITCDAAFRRLILGNDGVPLALGKTQYPFTAAQRLVLTARDGGCVMCGAPAAWCDAHHIVPYNGDGARGCTDIDNGVLLCPRHHDLIHHSEWQIRMVDGLPYVLAPRDIDPWQQWKRVGHTRVLDTGWKRAPEPDG